MKQPTLTILLLLALPLIAAVQIHTVYYDPVTHQRGGEFVLLENTGDQPISVEDWRLATTVSEQDNTLTGTIGARSYYLAADLGFDEHKDDPSWPSPDHEQRMTLANNDGFVQLINAEGEIKSTVGWGDPERSEETPHPGAPKGEALVRTNNTGDNAHDFAAKKPVFTKQQPSSNATFTVTVNNTPPKILNYSVPDDNPQTPGIQLHATKNRLINVSLHVTDNNTVQELVVTANKHELTTNDTGITATYTGVIPYTNEVDQIVFRVRDDKHEINHTIPVTNPVQTTISIPDNIQLSVNPGGVASTHVPVTNTAEHPIDLRVRGTAPASAQQLLGNVSYSVQTQEVHALTNEFRVHALSLAPGEEALLKIHVHAQHRPARAYAGQIIIAGTPAR